MHKTLKNITLLGLIVLASAAAAGGILWGLNTKATTPREKEILGWLIKNEPEPQTFSPDITDRAFWEARQKDTKQKDPPTRELKTVPETANELNVIIATGTEQELRYDTGAWIPTIEAAISQVLDLPWSEALQGQEFTDLHASQTAGSLGRTIHALRPRLNPELVDRTMRVIRAKVTGPFFKDAESYQRVPLVWGRNMCAWLEGSSNWTAVCINNILYAILATEPSVTVRAHAIALAESPLEEYLNSAEEDGYLGSGIRYWNYGFGNLMILNERLDKATGGMLNLSKNEKVNKMGQFKQNWLVWQKDTNEYFPLFADNNNPTPRRVWLEELCYRRFGTPAPETSENRNKETAGSNVLDDLMAWLPAKTRTEKESATRKESSYWGSSGALVSRHSNGKTILAVKGGSNREEHNHNDMGSYTLFDSGTAVTGDQGTVTYTIDGFSKARYENDVMSSFGHPVPVAGGHLQTDAESAKANVVSHKITPERDEIEYDIISAYKTPGLTKLTRTVTFEKTGKPKATISDSFEADFPITFETALISAKSRPTPEGNLDLGEFVVRFKSDVPTERVEERFWRDNTILKRTASKTSGKFTKGTLSYTIEKN